MFLGEIGERLDDFIYQVEEFAAFHAWDPMQAGQDTPAGSRISLHPMHPMPLRDWTELSDLLTRRFQPRDLTTADKRQFWTRRRQRSKDIPTYVDALQK